MLDMGFWPDVRRIIDKLPPQAPEPVLLGDHVAQRARRDRRHAERPRVRRDRRAATPVDEVLAEGLPGRPDQKIDLLIEYFRHHKPERALIFTRTKHRADRLARTLNHKGVNGTTIHCDRTQSQREQALDGFKSGEYTVLVATDIVARGIDVEGISHVINYDIPINAEDYVHRIGRTARAGAERYRRQPADRRRGARTQGDRAPHRRRRSTATTCPASTTTSGHPRVARRAAQARQAAVQRRRQALRVEGHPPQGAAPQRGLTPAARGAGSRPLAALIASRDEAPPGVWYTPRPAWATSSVGRAPARQAGGRWFNSNVAHHLLSATRAGWGTGAEWGDRS